MVMGTHHMLLPIRKVLLGATSHATGDVLPLNSVAPPAHCASGEAGCHGSAHRGGWAGWWPQGDCCGLPLTSSRSKLDHIFKCPLTQSGN